MVKIVDFAENVYFREGIWYAKNSREISYPKEGNMKCYEIEKDSFWFKHRNNCIIEAVKTYSPIDTFFDIGGGNGYVAKSLQENNVQTVLIEPGLEGALNAKGNGLENIICSTFEDAGIKHNYCKAIGLFDVVEHVKDDKEFLNAVNSILADNGLVYITVPAYQMLWSNEDVDAGHFRRYTIRQISSTLNEVGFKVEYATYFFSILPFPIFLSRTLPSLIGFNKGATGLTKHKQEHSKNKGIITPLLDAVWDWELKHIKQRRKIFCGSSCFVIARKTAKI